MPPVVNTHQTAYCDVTYVQLPPAIYLAALAPGYHHLGDFYALGGMPRGEQDVRTRCAQSGNGTTGAAELRNP